MRNEFKYDAQKAKQFDLGVAYGLQARIEHAFAARTSDPILNLAFAEGVNEGNRIRRLFRDANSDSCEMGKWCSTHDFVHGFEAEELRSKIEDLIELNFRNPDTITGQLQNILENVDARDSVAYLELMLQSEQND